MGTNFDRFLSILSKWPVEPHRKAVDYGLHLRKIVKNKDVHGNIFPGSAAENSEKLSSLSRLTSNVYGAKNLCHNKLGASGINKRDLETMLENEFTKYLKQS